MSICSTASRSPATESRRNLWLVAAIAPTLTGPVWLSAANPVADSLHSFSGLVLVLLLACTTFTDLHKRKIYNWATYTACCWGLAINFLPAPISTGSIGAAASASGMVGCFAVMLVPYNLARGGAGDVKLAAAIGSLLGFGEGMLVIAFTYIIAAVCIVGWTVLQKGPLFLGAALIRKAGFHLLPGRFAAPATQQTQLLTKAIPLAGFFAIGTLFVVFDGPIWLRSFQ